MRILLVGATGYVGSAVLRALLAAGHSVVAHARSEAASHALQDRGVDVIRCDLTSIVPETAGLQGFDGCIWVPFLSLREERDLMTPLLEAFADRGGCFIYTSGTAVLGQPSPDGRWSEESFAEEDEISPPAGQMIRHETESFVRSFARRGVRAIVIRPPLVWGHGGSRQIPWLFETARKTGRVCYVGQGLNVYSHVHVDDLAQVYVRALEQAGPGALYHAVAGEENFRSLAEAVAGVLGCSAEGVSLDEMAAIIGRTAAEVAFAMNSRSRSPRTRRELGWNPVWTDIIQDIRAGSYRARYAAITSEHIGGTPDQYDLTRARPGKHGRLMGIISRNLGEC